MDPPDREIEAVTKSAWLQANHNRAHGLGIVSQDRPSDLVVDLTQNLRGSGSKFKEQHEDQKSASAGSKRKELSADNTSSAEPQKSRKKPKKESKKGDDEKSKTPKSDRRKNSSKVERNQESKGEEDANKRCRSFSSLIEKNDDYQVQSDSLSDGSAESTASESDAESNSDESSEGGKSDEESESDEKSDDESDEATSGGKFRRRKNKKKSFGEEPSSTKGSSGRKASSSKEKKKDKTAREEQSASKRKSPNKTKSVKKAKDSKRSKTPKVETQLPESETSTQKKTKKTDKPSASSGLSSVDRKAFSIESGVDQSLAGPFEIEITHRTAPNGDRLTFMRLTTPFIRLTPSATDSPRVAQSRADMEYMMRVSSAQDRDCNPSLIDMAGLLTNPTIWGPPRRADPLERPVDARFAFLEDSTGNEQSDKNIDDGNGAGKAE